MAERIRKKSIKLQELSFSLHHRTCRDRHLRRVETPNERTWRRGAASASGLDCSALCLTIPASLEASSERAKILGPYSTWKTSPAARGKLQMDMWQRFPSGSRDFSVVRSHIARDGLRNSMLTAQMPTASTAQVLGNAEGVDPYSR